MSIAPGKLEIIIGCMFSGKTSELVRRINRLVAADQEVLLIKYKNDTRYSESDFVTHNMVSMPARRVARLAEVLVMRDLLKYQYIIIDEAQFFPDLFRVVIELVNEKGINVIIAALQGNFKREPMGETHRLFPYAHSIDQLRAICMICKKEEAHLSMKIAGYGKEEEDIGGAEKYKAVCGKCFESVY